MGSGIVGEGTGGKPLCAERRVSSTKTAASRFEPWHIRLLGPRGRPSHRNRRRPRSQRLGRKQTALPVRPSAVRYSGRRSEARPVPSSASWRGWFPPPLWKTRKAKKPPPPPTQGRRKGGG